MAVPRSTPGAEPRAAVRAGAAPARVEPRQDPVEHVAEALERLAGDPYGAVVTLDADRALRDAAALRDELRRTGPRGPLHGVAVGVKDLIDVAGLPTRAGSAVRARAAPADRDAPVVARLRAAGAVVVAKLHTHEFGLGPTGDVAAEGPARNPHDPTRIAGGSSSGSAVAVAAGYLPLALGTDTGGSVRIPAALCGVIGLKPARGVLPATGTVRLAPSLDTVGLLAADPGTALAARAALAGDPGRPRGPRGARVGLAVDPYWTAAEPAVRAAVDRAAAALEAAGAEVREVGTPGIDEIAAAYMPILGAEAHARHAATLAERPGDYQPESATGLSLLAGAPPDEHAAALRTARRVTDRLAGHLAGFDAVLTPATRVRATPLGARLVDVAGERSTVAAALLEPALPANVTGWPALSVPVAGPGLPAGVQLLGVGDDADERLLLELAETVTHAPG
ncbi:amidase [Pseudonocardia ammonioxydans]|uniref:amidase n=1 Tax=Pseudonocardia ammonioxydans TaxID=260086 RepID=UPI000B849580|nr:amidase [Pseudonocardia ammonioxydans]